MRRAAASPVRVVAVAAVVVALRGRAGRERAGRGRAPIPAAPTAVRHRPRGLPVGRPAAASLEQRLAAYERGTGHQVWCLDRPDDRAACRWRTGRCARSTRGASGAKGSTTASCCSCSATIARCASRSATGWRGYVPDARAGRIIQTDIVPRIRAGDRDGAVNAGVDALMAAIGGTPDQGAPAARSARRERESFRFSGSSSCCSW